MIGSEEAVFQYLDRGPVRRDGPLHTALQTAAGKHPLVAGFNPAVLPRSLFEGGKPQPRKDSKPSPADLMFNLPPLLKASCITLSVAVDKETHGLLRLDFAGQQQAEEAVKAGQSLLNTGAAIARDGADSVEEQLRKPRYFQEIGKPAPRVEPKALHKGLDGLFARPHATRHGRRCPGLRGSIAEGARRTAGIERRPEGHGSTECQRHGLRLWGHYQSGNVG